MNPVIIIIIIVFIAFLYIYTFLKLSKKRKKSKQSSTKSPQASVAGQYKRRLTPPKAKTADKSTNYNNYVSKYNSQEDYRAVTPRSGDKDKKLSE
jgi:LPS O-antigen subunit length determinant protein (WzzB/FepE family)